MTTILLAGTAAAVWGAIALCAFGQVWTFRRVLAGVLGTTLLAGVGWLGMDRGVAGDWPLEPLVLAAVLALVVVGWAVERLAADDGLLPATLTGLALGTGLAAGVMAAWVPGVGPWENGTIPGGMLLGAAAGGVAGTCVGAAGLLGRPGWRWWWLLLGMVGSGLLLGLGFRVSVFGENVDPLWLGWVATGAGVLAAATLAAGVWRWQGRRVTAELAAEVALGVLPPWLGAAAPGVVRRAFVTQWPDRRERVVVVRLLTRLAFQRVRLQPLLRGERSLQGLELGRLRSRLREVLASRPAVWDGVEESGPGARFP